jgi:hypothetical protein
MDLATGSSIKTSDRNEANSSGVSWAAVVAGGFVSAALSLILLALGTGLGLSSVSVRSNAGVSGSALGTAAIIWLIATEFMSASMGGYLAGRLRTKWTGIHNDEVYFRDTAHGFLSWSVALVVTAAFLGSAAASMMGSADPKLSMTGHAEGTGMGSNAYFVDSLFRSGVAKGDQGDPATHAEAAAIMAVSLQHGDLSSADKSYLAELVSSKTGLTQNEADKRVSQVFSNAQQAAEAARKAVAHTLLWTFIALLIGAFCASFAGTIGGRQRDNVVLI